MNNVLWIILAAVLILLVVNGYKRYKMLKNYKPEDDSAHLLKLTDANFHRSIAKGVILVDFWAPWCAPCRMIAPMLNELADDYVSKAKVGKLNVDENKKIAAEFGIRSIPTLILFKDGKPVERITGVKPKSAFSKLMDKHLN
jgi:thioredoxin 1